MSEKKSNSDLFVRLRTGAIYAVVILVGSLLGNIATTIMVAAASGLSAYEFYQMLRSDAKLPNEMLGILASVAFPIFYYLFNVIGMIFVMVCLILCLLV